MIDVTADTVKKTFYELLETRAGAGRDEIEQAYRAAVMRLQPEIDAGRPDALNRLRLLRDAHHTLADPARRARYDAWMQARGRGGKSGTEPPQIDRRSVDGLGWAIVVAVVVVAIGGLLTLFLLLDRVEDVRTDYAEIVRQKKASESTLPRVTIVPRPAPGGGTPREKEDNQILPVGRPR